MKSMKLRDPQALRAAGKPADGELAKSLLKMIAVGIVGGATLLAGSKKVGEKITKEK